MTQQIYDNTAAEGYERAFARVSLHFVPFLLASGLAAAAALATVGPSGHVTAADISPHMVEQARKRLANASNVSFGVEDGQALSFPDTSFDTVLCSLGLMFFPDPARGLSEFHRVLRTGGRAAVSVNTVPSGRRNGVK